jgi:hypothetical protein
VARRSRVRGRRRRSRRTRRDGRGQHRTNAVRAEAKSALAAADPRAKTKDSDYVFITFIVTELPHGAIGLLVAVMFAAPWDPRRPSSTRWAPPPRSTSGGSSARSPPPTRRATCGGQRFTALWGVVAVAFALFAGFAENLIEAINILGSIFYGVILGIFWWRSSSGGWAAARSSSPR